MVSLRVYREDFPIFARFKTQERPFVYLDSAATAQVPRVVMDAVARHELGARANVHRGIYPLAEEATGAYEAARETVRAFLNARSSREVVFTRNATEGINLVARFLAGTFLKAGDRMLVSVAEHHSNFLPWQMLRDQLGLALDIVDVDGEGQIRFEALERAIQPQTKLAAFSHVSHVLGTINPIVEMARRLREHGALFLVDAAQSAAHLPIDVQALGCDFLVFSGHKLGAPMGIGVLWGREELLSQMPPFLRGGGMISEVTVEGTRWQEPPWKFEAGTPNVAGAIGLAAAIAYLHRVGFDEIRRIDGALVQAALERLAAFPGVRIFGPADPRERGGLVSFAIEGIHPHDLATILGRDGVCIRAGHHCAMPLHQWLGVPATTRASVWIYNTPEDIEALGRGIEHALSLVRLNSKSKMHSATSQVKI